MKIFIDTGAGLQRPRDLEGARDGAGCASIGWATRSRPERARAPYTDSVGIDGAG